MLRTISVTFGIKIQVLVLGIQSSKLRRTITANFIINTTYLKFRITVTSIDALIK